MKTFYIVTILMGFICMEISCNKKSTEKLSDEIKSQTDTGKRYEPPQMTSKELQIEMERTRIAYMAMSEESFEVAFAVVIQRAAESHRPGFLQFPFQIRTKVPPEVTITIHKENIMLADLLSELCKQANIEWHIEDGIIILHDKTDVEK